MKTFVSALLTITMCISAVAVDVLDAPKSEPIRPVNLSPAEAEAQGRALVADLLARKAEAVTNSGVLKIRAANRDQREVQVRFQVFDGPAGLCTIYEALPGGGSNDYSRLTITRTSGSANTYSLVEGAGAGAGDSPGRELTAAATMVPFAGSDFWVADLGLEFLHWPRQMLLRREMRKSRPCEVLESSNSTGATGYSKVVSWIDTESGGILHADAYDSNGALLKQFDPTELQKVGSERQVKEIEMRNRQTGTRSAIEFHLANSK